MLLEQGPLTFKVSPERGILFFLRSFFNDNQ